MAVQQNDIINGSITVSNIERYKINPGAEFEGSVTALTYTIGGGISNGPLQIKSTGTGNTGWVDEQDMQLFNVSFTGVTQVATLVGTVFSITTVTMSVTNGTVVGLYGAGAWATTGALTQPKENISGCGAQNAGLIAGGYTGNTVSVSELFNGVTWTTSGSMSQTKYYVTMCGSQNAGLGVGGNTNTINVSLSELFNGSVWATSGSMTQSKAASIGAGSQNAGLVIGGINSVVVSLSETFNGATWATSTVLSQSKSYVSGAGSQISAAAVGGYNGANPLSITELFNGSTWTISANLSQSKYGLAGGGTQNTSFITGGHNSANISLSEVFNGSVWATSGSMSQSKYFIAGCGNQGAGLMAGGTPDGSTFFGVTELHNQTTYRPLTWDNLRCATNIGVALGISGGTCNVALQGFAQNMSLSSTAGNFYVITKNSSTTTSTASYQTFKTVADAEDWIVGIVSSVTTSVIVANNPVLTFDEIKNWG